MRIVSVVPSLTELLFELKLDSAIVGITRFCIHPKHKVKSIKTIGGTKSLHINEIIALKPDLIIANKEENSKEDIQLLEKHVAVWITDINTFNDAISVIQTLGEKTNKINEASKLIEEIKNEFQQLKDLKKAQCNVAYVIWNNPIMLAGRKTYINQMLLTLNWKNVLLDETSRYPEVDLSYLDQLDPDIILLSTEPFPFNMEHVSKFQSQFPKAKVHLVDGEMFSWYGSRMKFAPKYFKQLLLEVQEA